MEQRFLKIFWFEAVLKNSDLVYKFEGPIRFIASKSTCAGFLFQLKSAL